MIAFFSRVTLAKLGDPVIDLQIFPFFLFRLGSWLVSVAE